jgi:hypothetical protein
MKDESRRQWDRLNRFVHADGSPATGKVIVKDFQNEAGDPMWFELVGQSKLGGIPGLKVPDESRPGGEREVYRRLIIIRVYPAALAICNPYRETEKEEETPCTK